MGDARSQRFGDSIRMFGRRYVNVRLYKEREMIALNLVIFKKVYLLYHTVDLFTTQFVFDLSSFKKLLIVGKDLTDEQIPPVLVVGAGLSAADAIMAARFRGIPVLHAFRNSLNEWGKQTAERITTSYDRLQWLPDSIYPEYHKVYEMMADGGTNYPLYKSLPGYTLVSLCETRENGNINTRRIATLSSPNGQLHKFEVSIAAILIGKYNIYFLITN